MTPRSNRPPTLHWRKSSASMDKDECVEVARAAASVLVRDSRNRHGAVLAFTREQWEALVTDINNGEFDWH